MTVKCRKPYFLTVGASAPTVDAYWTFDEAGNAKTDKVHGIVMTASNAPGTGQQTLNAAPALFSNGLNFFFDAGGSSVPQISTGAFAGDFDARLADQGNGFSWAGWFKFISTNGVPGPVSMTLQFEDALLNDFGAVTVNLRGVAPFWRYSDSLGVHNTVAIPNPTPGAWTFFHIFYDPVSKQVGFALNNAAPTMSPDINLSYPISPGGSFFIFGDGNTGSANLELDEFAFKLSRPFTASELTYLFNSGAGRTWPL